MSALYQRLRELSPAVFEDLCFQILSERHPDTGITRVSGAGGDKGIDIFQGELSGRPTIWQCKYFNNGIRSPQKKQIKKSFRTALKNFRPKRWILCIPVDLDTNAHAWLQEFRREQASRCEIGLFQASQIVRELIHRRPLRNVFFPGAALDTMELRSILARTGEYTNREIEKLALENVQQYLQRLRDRDARFNYQITYLPEQPVPLDDRGQILTVTNAGTRLDVFPRDIEALRLDPPQLHFTLSGSAVDRFKEAVETGVSARFGPGELNDIRSSFDFLIPEGSIPKDSVLILTPRVGRRFEYRVTFGSGAHSVAYGLLEFTAVRSGTTEIEIATVDTDLPFRLSVVFRISQDEATRGRPADADFSISHHFAGRSVQAVKKFNDALSALKECGVIEFYDSRRDRVFFKAELQLNGKVAESDVFSRLLNDLCEVSDRVGQQLNIPERLNAQQLEFLPLLLQIIRTGKAPMPISGLSATLVKDSEHADRFLQSLDQPSTFGMDLNSYSVPLLDTQIELGRSALVLEEAAVDNPEKVRREYVKASNGEGVVVKLVARGSVTLSVLRFLPSPANSDSSVRSMDAAHRA